MEEVDHSVHIVGQGLTSDGLVALSHGRAAAAAAAADAKCFRCTVQHCTEVSGREQTQAARHDATASYQFPRRTQLPYVSAA